MSATAIAVITWVVGLAAIVGGLFEIRRLRQSDVPQHKINQFTVALLVITGAATVTELVALGTEPQPSPDSSQSTAGLVALIVTNVATTAFVIAVVVLRSRRVRRETARLGEPPLTRRASLRVAAPGTDALYWSKVALHAIDAVNIEIDLDALQISAETQGQWNDVGRYVSIEVEPNDRGESEITVTAWPKAELATHDLGGGQYFVNNLAKDITTISLDPPDPETPQNECRRLLTDVINSPTANEAVKSDAVNALALLEAHDDPGAALLTRRVIDGIRSLPLGDPARRIAEREVDSMIHALGTVEVP